MREDGSLFLNVGAKPTDPWIPLEVAQVARRQFKLQNTIHWVKSIAIDREAAGAAAGLEKDVAVGHYKPINSDRFVNDCHEFIFHFSPGGRTRARSARRRRALSGSVEHQALGEGRQGPPLPRQYLVHSLRDDPEPRPRPAASRVVSAEGARAVRAAARPRPRRRRDGSVPRAGLHRDSPRRGSASTSSGSRWTSTTCARPSSGSDTRCATRNTRTTNTRLRGTSRRPGTSPGPGTSRGPVPLEVRGVE